MSPALQNSDAAPANGGVFGMVTYVAFVVPAAVALGPAGAGYLDHRGGVVLAGQQFGPGLPTQLQLGHQQPVAQAIHLGMSIGVEPLEG